MTKAELMALRALKLKEAKALLDKSAADNRDMTKDEAAKVATLTDEAKTLKAQIEALDARDAMAAEVDAELKAASAVPARKVAADSPKQSVTVVKDMSEEDGSKGFKSPRDFLMAVMRAGQSSGFNLDRRLKPLAVKKEATAGSDEQGEYSDPYGGFLIPPTFAPNLLSVATEGDPTAGRTTRVPMTSPVVKINARTDKNHTSSVSGGLRFYRRAETDTSNPSRMEFEQVELQATSLMGLAYATEEILTDSPVSFIALLEAGFRDELGATLFNEKIRGTGAGQYLGVLNAPCTVSVAKETGQTADTINYDNVIKMRARCWGYSDAIWLANHDAFPQIAKLQLPVGVAGSAVYMPSIVEDRPDMLLGRPIFYTEYAETVGDSGDLILANFSQYLEGELQGMNMAESVHVRFVNNERAFRVTVRNDGRPWWKAALSPKKGANTLSPFVKLDAR